MIDLGVDTSYIYSPISTVTNQNWDFQLPTNNKYPKVVKIPPQEPKQGNTYMKLQIFQGVWEKIKKILVRGMAGPGPNDTKEGQIW